MHDSPLHESPDEDTPVEGEHYTGSLNLTGNGDTQ